MKNLSRAQKDQLWPLIEEYAEARAQEYYMDDQGVRNQPDVACAARVEAERNLRYKMGLPLNSDNRKK